MNTIYVYANNGVIAVISEASAAKLDAVHAHVQTRYQEAVAANPGSYVDTGPLYTEGYELVGRIPVASFVRDEYIGVYAPYVTGTHSEFEKLRALCHERTRSIGVPFSNGEIDDPRYTRTQLAEESITLTEFVEIFGIAAIAGLTEEQLATSS